MDDKVMHAKLFISFNNLVVVYYIKDLGSNKGVFIRESKRFLWHYNNHDLRDF